MKNFIPGTTASEAAESAVDQIYYFLIEDFIKR